MAAISICAGVLYHISQGRAKWFAACVLPFTLNTVVAASSRASFLALACGGLALFWFRPPRETARLLLYGLLAAALFLSLASEFFWERMGTMLSATKEDVEMERSAASRFVIAASQWRIFLDHPLGTGHKGTAALSYTYIPLEFHSSQGGRSSHNTLLSVLVDQGVVGIVIWTGMLVAIWHMCRTNHRTLRRVGDRRATWINATIAAAMFAIFVGGMFSQQVKLEINYWLMSLLMAMSSWVTRTYPRQHGERRMSTQGATP
jgi:O-antigen ligase